MAEATEENPIVFFDVTLGGMAGLHVARETPPPRIVHMCFL